MITEEALRHAYGRVEAFARVNQARTAKEKVVAVDVMLDSLGLDENHRADLNEFLTGFVGDVFSAPAMVGVLLGLFIRQYEEEECS